MKKVQKIAPDAVDIGNDKCNKMLSDRQSSQPYRRLI